MLDRYVSRKNLPRLLACMIFLFAFLLYRNSVPNGYTLDDAIYYTENKFVQQGIKGIPGIFSKSTYFGFNGNNDQIYRPLPVACFAIEHSLHGNNPHFNHFINVIIYALCCSLLFFLLHRLFAGESIGIPFCITLLFTAHPIHTEVVASIKGLDEILAFLFSVLTLYCLLWHSDRKNTFGGLVAGLLSYLLCLLSKEHGLTLLGILPVALFTFRSLPIKRIVLLTLPFCLVALFYIVFRSRILDYFTFGQPLDVYNNALLAAHNRAAQLATAFVILGKYLRLLFIPYPLCWDYSYNQIPDHHLGRPKGVHVPDRVRNHADRRHHRSVEKTPCGLRHALFSSVIFNFHKPVHKNRRDSGRTAPFHPGARLLYCICHTGGKIRATAEVPEATAVSGYGCRHGTVRVHYRQPQFRLERQFHAFFP